MTSRQLAEWEVFYSINPNMETRIDYNTANLASLITNLTVKLYGKNKNKTTKIQDFVIDWDPKQGQGQEQEGGQLAAALIEFARQHNASIDKKEQG